MNIKWKNHLPIISLTIETDDGTMSLENVLIDTGAASSLFNVDHIFENGMSITPNDTICKMIGIGGAEFVIQRQINSITLAGNKITNPTVQFGEMDYGFELDGILGVDILKQMSTLIDFGTDTLITNHQ